jgi:hypothetical protein
MDLKSRIEAAEKLVNEFGVAMTTGEAKARAIGEACDALVTDFGEPGRAAGSVLMQKFIQAAARFSKALGDLSKPAN